MNTGQTVFSQVIARVPHWEFQRLAQKYELADGRRQFSAWDHFLALAFAQMTFRQSLRDVEACLRSPPGLAYQLGFRSGVTRSTLARANEERSWELFAALAQKLMGRARTLYQKEPHVLDLVAPAYAVDSTLIDLSMALCPWANWTGTDAAVKMHTALDLRGALPAVIAVTEGERGDVTWLDELPIEAGSFYIMDRGYIDFRRLNLLAQAGAFFVIRDRKDVISYVMESRPVDLTTSVRADQIVRLSGAEAKKLWLQPLRRVSIYDSEHSRRLAFWTNQFTLSAVVIAELYRLRWQVELFFRWVKQSLRLHTFYGTSANAIRVQIWSAIATYLAITITRKELGVSVNPTTFIQLLSLHALSKVPLPELLKNIDTSASQLDIGEQMVFNKLC